MVLVSQVQAELERHPSSVYTPLDPDICAVFVAYFTLLDSLRPDMKDVLFRAGALGIRFEMVIGDPFASTKESVSRCRCGNADPHYVGYLCE